MLVDIAFANYMQRNRIIIDQLTKNNCLPNPVTLLLAYKYSTISHLMDIFGQLCPTTLRPR